MDAGGATGVEQAVGRLVGSLCVVTGRDEDAESAMLASWVSQVGFALTQSFPLSLTQSFPLSEHPMALAFIFRPYLFITASVPPDNYNVMKELHYMT